MSTLRTLTLIVFTTALATGALAKGHDQSGTATPGANVGSETVSSAQTLGAARGNGQDNSGKTRGKSAQAGRE